MPRKPRTTKTSQPKAPIVSFSTAGGVASLLSTLFGGRKSQAAPAGSSTRTGPSQRGSRKKSAPASTKTSSPVPTPRPTTAKISSPSPSPSRPSRPASRSSERLTDDDVLNKLSARGVSSSVINTTSMADLRAMERSTRRKSK